jgi:hypothetical protein
MALILRERLLEEEEMPAMEYVTELEFCGWISIRAAVAMAS